MSAPVLRLLLPVVCLLLGGAAAQAQEAPPLPPAPEPVPPPPPETAPPSETVVPAPAPPAGGPTDHDSVVGHWGIEAKQLGAFQRTLGNDPTCGTDCPIPLNSFGVRRWHTSTYAWSAGLALAFGGGSRADSGAIKSWDTYFGIGPTVAASFLLTNWRHLAVSASPQLDAVLFMPRGSGPKTFLINARGLIEGELHLGFISLPEISVGVAGGLVASYMKVTKALTVPGGNAISSKWSIGFSGPQTLWGVVTNVFLRFYF
jgi:hypothetical protein